MKTKSKIVAIVEIAIVLCSLFLVAIPAIAAEQNQEMQKASANTITTASEDDYVLGVYGNANEDDTIDMRDLTYVKLIFFGKKPETELADAKYDGKINPLDFIQIKLIIVGKEKELTIVQYIRLGAGDEITKKAVTVPIPIKSIVAASGNSAEVICIFGEQDKIIGVVSKIHPELKKFLEDKPNVGSSYTWDMEKILELKPDIVLAYAHSDFSDYEKTLKVAGIPLVRMDFYQQKKYPREIRNFGWILGNKEKAEELIDFEQHYLNLIKGRVEDLTDEQKTRVYWEAYGDYKVAGLGLAEHTLIITCGGINIFGDIIGLKKIDPEALIERNPQVILLTIYPSVVPCNYGVTDTGPMEELRNSIMNRPGLANVNAVKNKKVYLLSTETRGLHSSVSNCYVAKYLHPELFEDIDPVDIHREWFERFLGIEYKGVYAYPAYPV